MCKHTVLAINFNRGTPRTGSALHTTLSISQWTTTSAWPHMALADFNDLPGTRGTPSIGLLWIRSKYQRRVSVLGTPTDSINFRREQSKAIYRVTLGPSDRILSEPVLMTLANNNEQHQAGGASHLRIFSSTLFCRLTLYLMSIFTCSISTYLCFISTFSFRNNTIPPRQRREDIATPP